MNNELRELLLRIVGDSYQDSLRAVGELRALLAKPAKLAKSECPHCLGDSMFGCAECEPDDLSQHQGEPVAWMDEDGALHTTLDSAQFSGRPVKPLYTRPAEQPAPVAVVLPTKEDFKTWADRRTYDLSHSEKGIFHNIDTREAWFCFKAGADATARLNPPQQ